MTFENKYKAQEKEKQIREFWEKNNIYKFDENSKKVVFSIDTPPPTISGKMHIGHAFSFTQTDFMARYKRQKGFEVFYPFGTDNNGLATEKLVQKAQKVNLRKVPRKEAIKICNEYLKEERPKFIADFIQIGLSCDFNLSYSTIDNNSMTLSQQTFLDLAQKGLVERKEGPVMWDRVFQTPIAQAELEDKELKSSMNYIKAKIAGTENTYLIYATTRPELLFACAGVSIEDNGEYVKLKVEDEYWIFGKATYQEKLDKFKIKYEIVEELTGQNLIGEKAIIPITNKEIKITHDTAIKADFGTGIAYFCSYGGIEDIEYFARHKLKPIEVLQKDGRLNNKCMQYENIMATEARPKVLKDLEESKELVKSEKITHIVNIGERSGVEVEYIVTKQWYVKYLDKKEYFFEMAQKFNWHPGFMKHRLENWIKGLNWDWGFSRQRHFGIPVPVWYCKKCQKPTYAQSSQLPIDPTTTKPKEKCSCGNNTFEAETDIMDTWFTSASSPFLAIELVKNKEMKKKLFPMDLRPQAHDIINFWLFYTMAKSNLLHGENPFKNVAVSGWVLDPKGKKMSKSKGNTISPQEITEKYSNDALRFAASSTKLGNDMPFQEKEVQSGVKLVNKLYNANKFASMLLNDFTKEDIKINIKKLSLIDKWILAKTQETIKEANIAFNNYDYQKAKQLFYELFMNDIANNYIEIVKDRLWKKKENYKNAQKTLYYILLKTLKGFSPIIPFITEEIYQIFYKQFEKTKSIHISAYPEINKDFENQKNIQLGNDFIRIVEAVRKFKSENNVSMKTQLTNLTIECSKNTQKFIENSIEDLKAVTGAIQIKFGKGKIETQNNDIKIDCEILKE